MLARARSVEVVWVPALLPCIVPCSTPHPPHNCTEKTGAVGVMVGCEHPTLVPLLEAVLTVLAGHHGVQEETATSEDPHAGWDSENGHGG